MLFSWGDSSAGGERPSGSEGKARLFLPGVLSWWTMQDLNLRPSSYKGPALTAAPMVRRGKLSAWRPRLQALPPFSREEEKKSPSGLPISMVAEEGLEPPTCRV